MHKQPFTMITRYKNESFMIFEIFKTETNLIYIIEIFSTYKNHSAGYKNQSANENLAKRNENYCLGVFSKK